MATSDYTGSASEITPPARTLTRGFDLGSKACSVVQGTGGAQRRGSGQRPEGLPFRAGACVARSRPQFRARQAMSPSLTHVDKRRGRKRIDVGVMKSRRLSAVLGPPAVGRARGRHHPGQGPGQTRSGGSWPSALWCSRCSVGPVAPRMRVPPYPRSVPPGWPNCRR